MLPEGYGNVVVLFDKGGVIMWPILACSVVALAIAIERFFSLRRIRIDAREFMDSIRTLLRQSRVQEAIDLCDTATGPIARIVKAGLLRHGRAKEDIRASIESAGRLEMPKLERFLPGLGTCASVAPLLGLLGTVQGMIKCFSTIQDKAGQVNPSDLAEGVGNALITTFAGLMVAIPALVIYNYFVTRVDNLVLEMEVSSSELVELLVEEHDHEV